MPLKPIFDAYEQGRGAVLYCGRSLDDLVLDDQGKIRPIRELLSRELRARYGMLLVTYSLACGLDWDEGRIADARDRKTIRDVLAAHGLLDIPADQNEAVRVMRGIASTSRTPAQGLKWADGGDLRFTFLLEFAEHLAPGSLTNGTQTDAQIVAIELAHLTTQSLALRSSGNFIIVAAREGLVDPLVVSALHGARLNQPDQEEKARFVEALEKLYSNAHLEEGLTRESVVHLSTNTPNRTTEGVYRAAHRTRHPVTARDLTAEKGHSVEQLSDESLVLLDTQNVADLDLRGANVTVPRDVLARYARGLAEGNRCMPICVLLVGPPGTAKTDLAALTARLAGVPGFKLLSPKTKYVGETERKARLQQTLLEEWRPNLAFVDEITDALPMERSDFDGDSGATRAVGASLLTALSDESRRGNSLLIGTSNTPWRIGAAMKSRFVRIPVLHPLREDFAAIVVATARRVSPSTTVREDDPVVRQAADVFFGKGANPRHIRSALSDRMLSVETLDANAVLAAAKDFLCDTDLASVVYADLWAVKTASFNSHLPWADDPAGYPYPAHLSGIVDPESGEIDREALSRRIAELKPQANV